MIDVRVFTDYLGFCRSTVCSNLNCEDRRRDFVKVVVDDHVFSLSVGDPKTALSIADYVRTKLGL